MKILDFLKKKNKYKQVGGVSQKSLFEKYDDITPRVSAEILEGHRGKEFVRFDANFFADMIEEIKNNPNCSYVTYINNLIKDGSLTPSYISVLKKKFDKEEFWLLGNEILSSRIANAMGVPAVYNSNFESNNEKFLLSVDFLEYGSKIINIEDWRNELSETIDIHIDASKFVKEVLEMEEIIGLHNLMDNNNQWKVDKTFRSDYLKYYLTRNIIVGDTDSYPRNVCFVVDKDNHLSIGPLYDTECAFVDASKNVYDIIFAMKYLPSAFEDFNEKYKNLISKQSLNEIFRGFDKNFISNRCKYMKECYNQYEDLCNKAKEMLELDNEKY